MAEPNQFIYQSTIPPLLHTFTAFPPQRHHVSFSHNGQLLCHIYLFESMEQIMHVFLTAADGANPAPESITSLLPAYAPDRDVGKESLESYAARLLRHLEEAYAKREQARVAARLRDDPAASSFLKRLKEVFPETRVEPCEVASAPRSIPVLELSCSIPLLNETEIAMSVKALENFLLLRHKYALCPRALDGHSSHNHERSQAACEVNINAIANATLRTRSCDVELIAVQDVVSFPGTHENLLRESVTIDSINSLSVTNFTDSIAAFKTSLLRAMSEPLLFMELVAHLVAHFGNPLELVTSPSVSILNVCHCRLARFFLALHDTGFCADVLVGFNDSKPRVVELRSPHFVGSDFKSISHRCASHLSKLPDGTPISEVAALVARSVMTEAHEFLWKCKLSRNKDKK